MICHWNHVEIKIGFMLFNRNLKKFINKYLSFGTGRMNDCGNAFVRSHVHTINEYQDICKSFIFGFFFCVFAIVKGLIIYLLTVQLNTKMNTNRCRTFFWDATRFRNRIRLTPFLVNGRAKKKVNQMMNSIRQWWHSQSERLPKGLNPLID